MQFTDEKSAFYWLLIWLIGGLLVGYVLQPPLLQAIGLIFGLYCCFKILSYFGFGPLVRK